MSGFLGLRKHQIKTAYDAERERREQHQKQNSALPELEKRSWEKVQDILQDQEEVDVQEAEREQKGTRMREMADKGIALTVEEIMSTKVATVKFDDTVMTVKGIFGSVRFHHLIVVDEYDQVIGILSDRDFLKSVSPFFGTINEQNRDIELMKRKAGMVMTRNPVVLGPRASILDAIQLMNDRKVSCIPIVERPNNKLLGVVTWKDIVRAFFPEGFRSPHASARLKTGVNIRSKTAEDARLKTTESARLTARPDPDKPERAPEQ